VKRRNWWLDSKLVTLRIFLSDCAVFKQLRVG
jgi:hypothetical protein